jgi:hypothetical protein
MVAPHKTQSRQRIRPTRASGPKQHPRVILEVMNDRPNLADPSFEPTDEQLIGLSARAFANVARKHQVALEQLRAKIAEGRRTILRELDEQLAAEQAG